MPAEFVPLSDLLRATALGDPTDDAEVVIAAAEASTASAAPANVSENSAGASSEMARASHATPSALTASVAYEDAVRTVLRDVRLFRARLADTLDESAARMLRDLAADVLVRELRLAPCDVRALVQRAMNGAPLVRVRLAPDDARLAPDTDGMDFVADVTLSEGDVIVEVVGGVLDLRLGVRFADILEAFA